jgi:hypothetical protein
MRADTIDIHGPRGSRVRFAGQLLFWPLLLKSGLAAGGVLAASVQYLVAAG